MIARGVGEPSLILDSHLNVSPHINAKAAKDLMKERKGLRRTATHVVWSKKRIGGIPRAAHGTAEPAVLGPEEFHMISGAGNRGCLQICRGE